MTDTTDEKTAAPTPAATAPRGRQGLVLGVQRMWDRLWQLPASLDGMLFLGMCSVVGLRFTSLVQLMVALPEALAAAKHPAGCALAAAAFAVESVWLARALIVARTPERPRIVAADAVFMGGVLLSQLWWTSAGDSYLTWQAWAFGVSMSTVLLIAVGTPRFRYALHGAHLLAACYLISTLEDARAAGATVTVITNALGYYANVLVARFVYRYLRRTAQAADEARAGEIAARAVADKARARADRARREAERLRQHEHRTFTDFLHDHTYLMQFLTEMDWSEIAADATRQQSVRSQAARAAQFYRSLVDGGSHGRGRTLADVLRSARESHAHLSVSVVAARTVEIEFDRDALYEFETILRTLLNNTDKHARAKSITVHAGTDSTTHTWEITVFDDGIGFDPATVRRGRGWGQQIPEAVAKLGAEVTVTSTGEGTLVSITGPLPPSTDRGHPQPSRPGGRTR